jgi:malic enzyme
MRPVPRRHAPRCDAPRHLALPRAAAGRPARRAGQDGSEALYYAMLLAHTRECMPLVYTPTVGQACQDWHRIFRHTPRGVYLSAEDAGSVLGALRSWPERNVKVIVPPPPLPVLTGHVSSLTPY